MVSTTERHNLDFRGKDSAGDKDLGFSKLLHAQSLAQNLDSAVTRIPLPSALLEEETVTLRTERQRHDNFSTMQQVQGTK